MKKILSLLMFVLLAGCLGGTKEVHSTLPTETTLSTISTSTSTTLLTEDMILRMRGITTTLPYIEIQINIITSTSVTSTTYKLKQTGSFSSHHTTSTTETTTTTLPIMYEWMKGPCNTTNDCAIAYGCCSQVIRGSGNDQYPILKKYAKDWQNKILCKSKRTYCGVMLHPIYQPICLNATCQRTLEQTLT